MFIWPSRPGSWALAFLIFYINEVNLILWRKNNESIY